MTKQKQEWKESFGIGSKIESSDGFSGRLTGLLFDPETTRTAAIVHFEDARAPWTFVVPWRVLKPEGGNGRLKATVPLRTIENCPLPAKLERNISTEDWEVLEQHYGVLRTPVEHRPSSGLRLSRFIGILVLLLLIGLTGVFGYLVYDSGWAAANDSVEEAAQEVKARSLDAATTARVKTALALSRSVSAFDVQVDTLQGVVTLSGTLPSEVARSVAIAIARDTSGVREVQDRLSIDTSLEQPVSKRPDLARRVGDLETKILIREALDNNDLTRDAKIKVDVAEGNVVLSGTASAPQVASEAKRLALSVAGVRSVGSKIAVDKAIRFD